MKVLDANPHLKDENNVPEGRYDVLIEGYDVKDTKSGTGAYLSLKMRIIAPARIGAVIYGNITLKSPSPGAVYYGTQQLKQLLEATGLSIDANPDLDEIIGKTVAITVKHKTSEAWGTTANVETYSKIEDVQDDHVEDDVIPF